MVIRKALIGNRVVTSSGFVGTVTGINSEGIARVACNGRHEDVPQDDLRKPDATDTFCHLPLYSDTSCQ